MLNFFTDNSNATPPEGMLTFMISNYNIYVSKDGNTFYNLGHAYGDINGVFPPSDMEIQTVFPHCSINYPLKTTKLTDLEVTFNNHSGLASRGDGEYFNVAYDGSAPTMSYAYFKMTNAHYFMSLDGVNYSSIGEIQSNPAKTPSNDQIQSVHEFYSYWWAEGIKSTTDTTRLFNIHTGNGDGDGVVFKCSVFSGPH